LKAPDQWIGEMPLTWEIKPLKAVSDYCVSNVDKVPSEDEIPVRLCNYTDVYKNEFITLDLDFMQSTATKEEILKFGLHIDDVIITKDSESWDDIGIPAFVSEAADDLVCGYHLALLRPMVGRIRGRYLFRCLQAKPIRVQLELAAAGVTRFGLPKDAIGTLYLPLPPIEQQDAIADYLESETAKLDSMLAAKQWLLDLLEEKRRALITNAITRGLNPGAHMKDSGVEWLGSIPNYWKTKRVKYLFRLVTEAAPPDNNFELLSLYTEVGVLPRKDIEARGNKATTTDNYWIVRPGDLVVNKLLAWMGAFGVSDYEGVTSPAYDILRPLDGVNSIYYHHLFRCGICFPEIRRRSTGIMDMRLRLYFDQFGDMRVPVPPENEQDAIIEYLQKETAKLDRLRIAAERTIDLLKERRSAIISAAVTGKLEVN